MFRIAIHQPNFVPWFPFFYKMAMVDKFVLLNHVQFEKGGYQNRFKYKDKWITKPVNQGVEHIADKDYVDLKYNVYPYSSKPGGSISVLNMKWIVALRDTFNIKVDLTDDWLFHETRPADKTKKLIDIIQGQTRGILDVVYVTSESAKDKYLDESMMRESGIEIEYCKVPKHLQRSTFEIIEEYGIEGAIKQLPKESEICAI